MSESQADLSVEHFRNILGAETEKLSQLCDRWSQFLESFNSGQDCQQPPSSESDREHEDLLGAIRTTIGQAKLLMSQRFKQFSDLIDHCEFNTGKLPTRLNDLSGFWEMMNYQVEDVQQKFKLLEEQQHKQSIGESKFIANDNNNDSEQQVQL